MRILLRLGAIAATAALLLTANLAYAGVQIIDPDTGPIGTEITIPAQEVDSWIDYEVWFTSSDYSASLTPVASDSNSITVAVPSTVCPGWETETCSSNSAVTTPNGYYSVIVNFIDSNGDQGSEGVGAFLVTGSPFTFTSVSASSSPIVRGQTQITVKGAGFNSITKLSLVSQDVGAQETEVDSYNVSNTQLTFTVPDSLDAGKYVIWMSYDGGSNAVTKNGTSWVFTVVSSSGTLAIDTGALPDGTVNLLYTHKFTATGGSTPYTWEVVSYEGQYYGLNENTGVFTTTPKEATSYDLKMRVTDALGNSDTETFKLVVYYSDPAGAHDIGTNVLGPDGTVYRISGATTPTSRSPYTSAGAFLSYKFNTWAGVVTANSADLSLPVTYYDQGDIRQTFYIQPRPGTLMLDHGTVYIVISGGNKAGFASEKAFKDSGHTYTWVLEGDTSFLKYSGTINSGAQKHQNGTLINDNGTFYVMHNGYRMGIPSMSVLDSWGYWTSDAVPANSYDKAAASSGVLQARMQNQVDL